MVMATGTERAMEPIPSVKDLASSDPALRRKNLQSILAHLEGRSPSHHLNHTQALQLWRGFHVSLYMHDSKNQLSVQTLIATLASTFKVIRQKDIELQSQSTGLESQNGSPKKTSISISTSKKGDSEVKDVDEDEFTGFDDDDDSSSPVTTQISDSWLSTYTSAFWETIAREWGGVDQWRINKYLLLIRFVIREIFGICLTSYFGLETATQDPVNEDTSSKKRKAQDEDSRKPTGKKGAKKAKKNTNTNEKPTIPNPTSNPKHHNSDPTITQSQLAILTLSPLSPRDRKVSDGLRFHMLDIYLDELLNTSKTVLASTQSEETSASKEEVKKAIEQSFLEPIRVVAKDGLAKHVRVKAKEVLAEFSERATELDL